MGGKVKDKLAFSLFRGIRRVSLIKIAQCLDPDPNLKNQKVKKSRDKSPKKGLSSISSSPVEKRGFERDFKKSERRKSKKDQRDQISRKSEKSGQAEIPRNQDDLFEKRHSGLSETGERPESPIPGYEPDYDEPGESKVRYF